ncbi:MAG: hypothetical protein J6Z06_05975, partial [Lachnospiraceae bacterium]|nr:hypothetical protein [Lachnospiraceae bacterium]
TMKKIMLASMVAAVALLAGCEIVVEEPSCEASRSYDGTRTKCITAASSTFIHQKCNEFYNEKYDTYEDFGCVGGEKKICTGYDDYTNTSFTVYFYTNASLDYDCNELLYGHGYDDYGDEIYLKNVSAATK